MSADMLERIKTICVHFTGVQTKVCGAGVHYNELDREKDPAVGLLGIPCTNPGCNTCDKREYPTQEAAQAEVDDWDKTIQEVKERLAGGMCPHCGKKVEKRVQVMRCVYAEPCGHRIGQGKA